LTAGTAGDLASHLYKKQKSHKKSGYAMVFINEKAFLGEFLVFNTAQYTVKKVSGFSVPSRDVTYQPLSGRE
jgi:hypothetical protein